MKYTALVLFVFASLAQAESCPVGQVVTGVTPTCSVVSGTTPPPATVTCPDGSTHPAGYVCPGVPPANVTCPDGSVHPPGFVCPTPPPSGAWNGTCPAYPHTAAMTINWSNPQRVYTITQGGFGPQDIAVVQFTTGAVASGTSNLPRIACAEYGTGPSARQAVLSERPCEFNGPLATSTGTSITIPFLVQTADPWGFYASLKASTTYYVNIQNIPHASCVDANLPCEIACDLTKPPGLGAVAGVSAIPAAVKTYRDPKATTKARWDAWNIIRNGGAAK